MLASLLCTADVPLSFTQITLLRYRREREREGGIQEGESERARERKLLAKATLSYSPQSVSYQIHVASVLQANACFGESYKYTLIVLS